MKINHGVISNQSPIIGVLSGVLSALVISFLLSIGLTSLLLNNSAGEWPEGIIMFAMRFIAVLIGGLVCTGIYKEKTIVSISIMTAAYFLILLIIGTIVYDSVFYKIGIGILSVLLGGATACLIRAKIAGKRTGRRRFKR